MDAGHHALIEAGLERFAGIVPRMRRCRFQVVHNDFSRSSLVMARGSDMLTLPGVIDFGNVVRAAVAIAVSTALLNQLDADGGPQMFVRGRDLLRGYLRTADLTIEEMALLPHLVMGRVIARALITPWRANQFPDNAAYILRNTHQGWAQLARFLSVPADGVETAYLGP